MGKFIDLTGQRFERLVVLDRSNDYVSKTGAIYVRWRCKCDCGNEVVVAPYSLKNGKVKSCSCLKNEYAKMLGENSLKELKGKRFGRLIVIERSNDYISPKGLRLTRWLCKCDCGNRKTVLGSNLIKENTTSCGCLSDSKLSSAIKEYILEKYNAKTEYKIFKNPKTNRWLPYDIYIPYGIIQELNGYYVEVHGGQHYCLNGWHQRSADENNTTPEDEFKYQKKKDRMKRKFARKNGIYIEIDLRKIKTIEDAVDFIENLLSNNLKEK